MSTTPGASPRRALSVVAALALGGAMMAPLAASADEAQRWPGSPAPESKIQDGEVAGAEFVPNRYFVELSGASTTEGGSLSAIESTREQFLADAAAAGAEVEVQSEFATLWNGLTVTADEGTLLDLANSDAVRAIFPVGVVDAPVVPETDIDPMMATAKTMTGADIVHSELGFTGDGVRIGIIDTGIDIDHPDFGGTGEPDTTAFPSAKVVAGYDFVGDSYNADPSSAAYQPNPFPDENPDDCQGHGTHVAGIAAADGEVIGVAPDALLGAYRVFGCDGSTDTSIMLHALEKAYADEMDVVNLSIGSAFASWKEYPSARATDALAREGVIVTASIGNSGANGLHSVGAPGVGEDTIGVGSVDNVAYMATVFLDEEDNAVPFTPATPSPEAPSSGTVEAVALGAPGTAAAQGCTAYTAEQTELVEGNWVLVERGNCTFHIKALNAQQAGAAGVLIYNNVPGAINPSVAGDPPITIPVVGLVQEDGRRLAGWALADGSTTITWTDEEREVPNPTGGLMSSFTSIGTMADTTFKPDLSAPGGSIYAPYPLEQGAYATLSGTSMAAPHVAGAAALLLQADPGLSVDEVRTKLQNSSVQVPLAAAPTLGLEIVHKQGAGMIQIDRAILADTVLEPGLIQLGQQLSGQTTTETVAVTNTGDEAQTYSITHEEAFGTYGTANDWYYWYADAEVIVPPTVVVPAGATVEVPVTITAPPEDEGVGPIFGGYLHFSAGDGGPVYTVAYGGYGHDLQDVEVLADMVDADGNVTQELPALAVLTGCTAWLGIDCVAGGTYAIAGGDKTFTMTREDHPRFLIHFEHQARQMVWEAFEANEDGSAGESLGVVRAEDYLSRSSTRNGFSAYTWDGMVVDENGARVRVPDGDYVMEIRVTKASAWNDERTPGVETYTSQAFGIEWSAEGRVDAPTVDRVMGHNRYATASELAVTNFEPGVETVFVATGQNYPDALAASALAGSVEAPVVLVKTDRVPSETRMALQDLRPERIVILGGPAAVSTGVEEALEGYAPQVERLQGLNRYDTAVQVSQEFGPSDIVFLASGLDYPDALAAAAAAGMEDAPVLLTHTTRLPSVTKAELDRLDPEVIVVVGGPAAVSGTVAEAAGAYGEVVRLGGLNRYETAGLIAEEFFPTPTPHAFMATGVEFPDALAAAPIAGMQNSPVLLTRPDLVPTATLEALDTLRAQLITIVGGYEAVSLEVQESLAAMVYSDD